MRSLRALRASLVLGLWGTIACAAPPPAPAPDALRREAAARHVAENDPACTAVRPFYWSIGDAAGRRADGRVGATAPREDTSMAIASASKMVYAAYVVQERGGHLDDRDVRFLTFQSGYTAFSRCQRGQTVGACDAWRSNGTHEAANDGRFYYGGGHMQRLATLDGLAQYDDAALAARINASLGTSFEYVQPQLAGGIRTTPDAFARFLRRIVAGELRMRDMLGLNAVCTNPATCPAAVYTPMPHDESPHYSIGHWVEDDPVHGDGAYSSAGAFGFYPWISRDKQWWGILARVDWRVGSRPGPGVESVLCGRRIRAAWSGGAPP